MILKKLLAQKNIFEAFKYTFSQSSKISNEKIKLIKTHILNT